MSGSDIYHDAMVRLARAAHGAGSLASPDATVTLDNALCGDRVTMQVQLRAGTVAAVAHRVRACILCEAAASLIGLAAAGATPRRIVDARASLAAILGGGAPGAEAPWKDLALFTPVAAVPSRHRCVLLPFDALVEALARAAARS